MTWFTCCWFQFFLGVLVGWILAWWFSRSSDDGASEAVSATSHQPTASHAPQPLISAPAESHSVAPAPAPKAVSRADMVAAAALAGISFKGIKNDLQIIEGIGPKIAGLMNEDGIHTFEDMANASIDKLSAVLEKAGPRFRLANASTWAQQARLAADGQWAELKALQDSLDGGIAK